MEQEPRRFVAGAEHPVQLMRRHGFFARRHQPRSKNPFRERDMRPFHNGADRNAKRLAAVFAVVDAGAKAFAGHFRDAVAHNTTARAYWTMRPKYGFEVLTRL